MGKKAVAILITALAVITICTAVGAAYLVQSKDSELVLEDAGDAFSDSVEIEGFVPGQAAERTFKAQAPKGAVFTLLLRGEGELCDFLRVSLTINGEEVFSGAFAEYNGAAAVREVSGEFEFTLSYSLPSDAGNGAQGLKCKISANCSLQEA